MCIYRCNQKYKRAWPCHHHHHFARMEKKYGASHGMAAPTVEIVALRDRKWGKRLARPRTVESASVPLGNSTATRVQQERI